MKGIWVVALKEWNARQKGKKYCIPKKGTKEHQEVLKIMGDIRQGKTGGFVLPLVASMLAPLIAKELGG